MSRGERLFGIINYSIMLLLIAAMIYPFWYLAMASLSDPKLTALGGLYLLPKGFTWDAYITVLGDTSFWSGFRVSIVVTILGSLIGTFLTAATAYAISKNRLQGRMAVSFLILFTMLFSGGLVPNYLLLKELGMLDTLWALIIPGTLSAFHIFVMRSFFVGLPEEVEEAAKIDGANDLTVFFRIVLPLSKAVLATIGLFMAVAYWNDFFSTILYITDKEKWQLQAVLRNLIDQAVQSSSNGPNGDQIHVSAFTVRSASILLATLPILLVYPFLQKHFVKGAMIGSIKG
ncbi:carbohydrate ABC transporter permease [Paenibacillus soyae]|uniref:Carbohydrate ABC transporter permease n=1 Tax=Paenibacillus soyae TaxID=2969249 RepID=A0A9X2MMJ5_9BACL|nr:carbohydrate ABC transporter permease [Paenibacillus soyae]MCR2804643.1 carbohydrate ABC transporter permease [Paenibacillus soyae]